MAPANSADSRNEQYTVLLLNRIPAVRYAALAFLLVFSSAPMHAEHSSSSLGRDRATKTCTHKGLPCSSAAMAGPVARRNDTGLRELDLIERQGLHVVNAGAEHKSIPVYRPLSSPNAKPETIEFQYHRPVQPR
jgi:hypothetical protein